MTPIPEILSTYRGLVCVRPLKKCYAPLLRGTGNREAAVESVEGNKAQKEKIKFN